MLSPQAEDTGFLFSYDGLDKDFKCQKIEFESPTELNGLDPSISKNPGILIANSFRRSSKI
jgi:hypothetical protein